NALNFLVHADPPVCPGRMIAATIAAGTAINIIYIMRSVEGSCQRGLNPGFSCSAPCCGNSSTYQHSCCCSGDAPDFLLRSHQCPGPACRPAGMGVPGNSEGRATEIPWIRHLLGALVWELSVPEVAVDDSAWGRRS